VVVPPRFKGEAIMLIARWVAAALLAMAANPAASQDQVAKWGQVGGWQISVDRTVGDGCFAVQVFERGSIVRIGFDVEQQKIYVLFGHDAWKSLEEGKIYPVKVVFDGASSYNGEMRGQKLGKVIFLAHRNLSVDFVKDFMQRNSMEVFYRGERIANLSLKNTYAAVSEILNCQRELGFANKGGGSQGTQDPFASAPAPRSRDPFR
jgi:hypothetical protein